MPVPQACQCSHTQAATHEPHLFEQQARSAAEARKLACFADGQVAWARKINVYDIGDAARRARHHHHLVGEEAATDRACAAADTSSGPGSTVIRALCQIATRSAAAASLNLCASTSQPNARHRSVSLPVPTTQHSRNRWWASSVEEPKAATVSSTNSRPSISRSLTTG